MNPTAAEADMGESTKPSEQPERIWMSPPPKTGVRLTVEECARQFELYAKSHPSPDSAHSLRFCADFLREFAVSPVPAQTSDLAIAARKAAAEIAVYLFATIFHPSRMGGISKSQEAEIAAIISRRLPPDAVQTRKETWDAAIKIAVTAHLDSTTTAGIRGSIVEALQAARAAALRADGKEKDD